jgi:hypothetical protein
MHGLVPLDRADFDARVVLQQQRSDVLRLESAIAAGAYAIGLYDPLIAPATKGVAVDVEKLTYLSDRQHPAKLVVVVIGHLILHLPVR